MWVSLLWVTQVLLFSAALQEKRKVSFNVQWNGTSLLHRSEREELVWVRAKKGLSTTKALWVTVPAPRPWECKTKKQITNFIHSLNSLLPNLEGVALMWKLVTQYFPLLILSSRLCHWPSGPMWAIGNTGYWLCRNTKKHKNHKQKNS